MKNKVSAELSGAHAQNTSKTARFCSTFHADVSTWLREELSRPRGIPKWAAEPCRPPPLGPAASEWDCMRAGSLERRRGHKEVTRVALIPEQWGPYRNGGDTHVSTRRLHPADLRPRVWARDP